jgi:hypothetical protein
MGMSSGYGAGAGAEMLQQILSRLADQAFRNQQVQQDQQRIDLARQQQQDAVDYKRAYLQSLEEQRQASANLRNQQAADRLAPNIAMGSVLDAGTKDVLTKGGYGGSAFLQHQGATVPSTAMQGAAEATDAAPTALRIVRVLNAGHPEQDVWRGTAQQQQDASTEAMAQRLLTDPNTPEAMRNYLQLRLGTRGKMAIPTAALPVPDRPLYQQQPDGSVVNRGTVPGNARIVNAPKPSRPVRIVGVDDPSFPRGVQAYITQLRGKYGDVNSAQAELTQAMPSLLQAHPSLAPVKAMNALRQAYSGAGHPSSGDALLEELLHGGAPPGAAAGGAAVNPGRGSGPAGGRGGVPSGATQASPEHVVSMAELHAIAQRRGTSVEQEQQRAAAAGYVVR